MRLLSPLVCAVVLLGGASIASAQDEPRLGFVIGAPAVAGVQWQITDRFAIRGDAAFSWNRVEQVTGSLTSGTNTVTLTTRSRSSVASAGVSALITVSRREQLRLYVAPRVAWQNVSSEFTTDTLSQFGGSSASVSTRSSSTTRNGVQFEGLFGGNYRLTERFSIFGETGLSLTTPTASSSTPTDSVKSHSFGSRSNVGVVIHF
jgi:hypothetical protein